jgi:hypothetical protein
VGLTTALGLGCDETETQPPAPPQRDAPEAPAPAPPPSEARSLDESLRLLQATPAAAHRPPTETESEGYRQWVGHLSTSLLQRTLPSEPPPAGFSGRVLEQGRVWLLSETDGENRGAGALALRVEARAPLIVQVPHSFFDRGTLVLGLSVFEEMGARALIVNTLHRGGLGAEDERLARVRAGSSASDVAHQVDSFFHLAHLQLGRIWPDDHVVQLHGFRDEKVPTAKIIVSASGTAFDPAPLARALNDALGAGTARLYPEEVDSLGGMTNVQARANRNESRKFVHLEVAASLRTQLTRQKSLRERFARALAKGLAVN